MHYSDPGEKILIDQVKRLKADKVICGHIYSGNSYINGNEFELDQLLIIENCGLVITESKYYAGTIYATGEPYWKRVKHGSEEKQENVTWQIVRQAKILRELLAEYGFDFPIFKAAVFTHPTCTLHKSENIPPAIPVLLPGDLKEWIRSLPKRQLHFSKEDFYDLRDIFIGHQLSHEECLKRKAKLKIKRDSTRKPTNRPEKH